MIDLDNIPDGLLLGSFKRAYKDCIELYEKHATHDCKENKCNRIDTDHIQIKRDILARIVEGKD